MKKNSGISVKWNVIVTAALLAAGLAIGLIVLLVNHTGDVVSVRVDGEVVAEFPLNEDTVYEIEGAGGGTNVLIIQDSLAWIEEASCPDCLCVNMGKISRSGQSIICLPNRVVVEISGASRGEDEPDVVAY